MCLSITSLGLHISSRVRCILSFGLEQGPSKGCSVWLTLNRELNEPSAYNVFNKGLKSLPGQLQASQFENELMHKY
jgi:hypothetical protein